MRALMLAGALLLVAAACSPTETSTPQPAGDLPTQPAPATATSGGAAPSAQPAAPSPTATAPAGAGTEPVLLQVLAPEDGVVVNTQQITVSGTASPGAVVTVNDDILIAGADGQFQDVVTLDEGLNLIEVIASNTSGSEASAELTVTYEP